MKSFILTAQSAWSTWYTVSDRCCQVTAAAWSIYVDLFFSPAAQARYEIAGRYLWLASAFVFGLGVVARRHVQCWVNEEVNLSLPAAEVYLATTEELFALADDCNSNPLSWDELPGMAEASDFDSPDYRIPAQAQSMVAPVATLTIALSESHEDGLDRLIELEDMTLTQLKPLAEKLNVRTNKVRKANLIADIMEAEGYKL